MISLEDNLVEQAESPLLFARPMMFICRTTTLRLNTSEIFPPSSLCKAVPEPSNHVQLCNNALANSQWKQTISTENQISFLSIQELIHPEEKETNFSKIRNLLTK